MQNAIIETLRIYAPHLIPHPAAKPADWAKWLAAWRDPDLCPKCGGALMRRKGRRGQFLGCNRYPECTYTRDAPPLDTSPRAERTGRYLTKAERAQASADKKAKRAAKRAKKKGKPLQREMVPQLAVVGFDYSEWGKAWTQ